MPHDRTRIADRSGGSILTLTGTSPVGWSVRQPSLDVELRVRLNHGRAPRRQHGAAALRARRDSAESAASSPSDGTLPPFSGLRIRQPGWAQSFMALRLHSERVW